MSSENHLCATCGNIVRPRQEAVECDRPTCRRWTHRELSGTVDDFYKAVTKKDCVQKIRESNSRNIPENRKYKNPKWIPDYVSGGNSISSIHSRYSTSKRISKSVTGTQETGFEMEVEDSDTHLCLTCHTTIVGLLNYVNHKKKECPGKTQPPIVFPRCDNLITLSNAVCDDFLRKNAQKTNMPNSRTDRESSTSNLSSTTNTEFDSSSTYNKELDETRSSKLIKSQELPITVDNEHSSTVLSSVSALPAEHLLDTNSDANSLHNSENNLSATEPPIEIERLLRDVLSHEEGLTNNDAPSGGNLYPCASTKSQLGSVPSTSTSKVTTTTSLSQAQENCENDKNDGTIFNRSGVEEEKCADFFFTLELQSKSEKELQPKPFTNTPRLGSFFSLDLPISAILDKLEFESDEENDSFNHMIDFPSSGEESLDDFDEEQLYEDRQVPPKTHTGGKWKPGECPKKSAFSRLTRPTQGAKWKPGSHTSQYDKGNWQSDKASTQNKTKVYTCQTCDLSFVNRYMYSNHCRTSTHKSQACKKVSSTEVNNKTKHSKIADEGLEKVGEVTSVVHDETAGSDIPISTDEVIENVTTEFAAEHADERLSNVAIENVPAMEILEKPNESILESKKTESKILEWKAKPSRQSYVCQICDKTLYSKYTFARHLLTKFHYNRTRDHPLYMTVLKKYHSLLIPLSPFQCLICQFFFNREEDLLDHLSGALHKKECRDLLGPMMCLICKYHSVTQDDFMRHMHSASHKFNLTSQHKLCIVKEKHHRIKCKFCGKILHSIGRMKRHLYVRHKDGLACPEVKRSKVRTTPSCSLCGKVCPSPSALTMHLRRKHTKEKPYHCTTCNRAFFNQHQLSLHNKSIFHQKRAAEGEHLKNLSPHISVTMRKAKEKVFKCEHCDFTAYSYPDLRPHYLKVHSSEVMNCELCDMIFLSSKALHVHQASKLHQENLGKQGDSENIFTCPICDKKYGDVKWFNFHMELTHNHISSEEDLAKQNRGTDITTQRYFSFLEEIKHIPKTTYIKCPQCHKDLQKEFMVEHLRIHTGEKPFQCKLCGTAFVSGITLRRHLITHMGLQNSTCHICGKTYKKLQSYKFHMKEHAEGDNRRFQCDVCGQGFHLHSQLRHHMKRHGERKFKCPYPNCEWTFIFKSELKFHLFSHTQEKPFLCDLCGFSASTKTRLARHKKTHSGERNFHCEYCPYKAGTRTHLRRHMRIHIGARPYSCPYCEYTCNTHENMRKHIGQTQKHKGLPVYPCKFCEHGSNSTRDFRNHLMSKHAAEVKDQKLEPLSIYTGLYNKESDPSKPLEGSQIIPLKERRQSKPKPKRKTASNSSNKNAEELPKHIKPVKLVRNQMIEAGNSTVIKKDVEAKTEKDIGDGVSDFINEQTKSCRDLLRATSEYPPNPKPIRQSSLSSSQSGNPEIQIILTQNADQQAIMVIADSETNFPAGDYQSKSFEEFTQLKQVAETPSSSLSSIYQQHIYPVQQEFTVITSEPTPDNAEEQTSYSEEKW